MDPASPEAHAAAGRVALNADWDWRAADAYLRRAVELNPGSVADLDRLAMDDPAIATRYYWRLWRAVAFVFSSQPVAARRTCDAMISIPGGALKGLAVCGFVFGRIGDASRLAEVHRALYSRSLAGEYVDPVAFAIMAAGERKHDDVLAHLERGAAERSALIIEIVAMPFFDEVRHDGRYTALGQRIGIPVAAVSAASQAPP